MLSFDGAGDYILFAVATDELGQEFTKTVSIKVYPVIHLALEIPENIHADKSVAVHTDEKINIGLTKDTSLPVTWSVTPSNAADYTGTLSDHGGTIQIANAGTYDISASPLR